MPVRPPVQRSDKAIGARLFGAIGYVATATEGNRNTRTFDAGCMVGKMVREGLITVADIYADILEAALHTGLDEREARKAFEQGLRREGCL
jgi:hypothetical protein